MMVLATDVVIRGWLLVFRVLGFEQTRLESRDA